MTTPPKFVFTNADRMQPVYCIGCRTHIPRAVSNAGRGLCPDCLAKIGSASAPTPPPVTARIQTVSQRNAVALKPLTILTLGAGLVFAALVPMANCSRAKGQEEKSPVIVAVDDNAAGGATGSNHRDAAQKRISAASASATDNRIQYDAEFATRWRQVSAIFEAQGASVEPWDSSAPRTMRIWLPASVSMRLSQQAAREMAGMARDRLDKDAIVYVKSAAGQNLGKATPWGFE